MTNFFDPSKLTDQEILDKLVELNRRYVWACKFSGSPQIGEQIKLMIDQCTFVHNERLNAKLFQMVTKNIGDTLDFDKGRDEQKAPAGKKPVKVRDHSLRITKSSEPVKDN